MHIIGSTAETGQLIRCDVVELEPSRAVNDVKTETVKEGAIMRGGGSQEGNASNASMMKFYSLVIEMVIVVVNEFGIGIQIESVLFSKLSLTE